MLHSCNYYCPPPVHAYKLLTAPGFTEAQIRASYARQGRQVDRTRPAPEADIAQWQQECRRGWTERDRHGRPVTLSPSYATQPWLVWLRKTQHED